MLADAIVEITETGSSLRANHLRILDTVLESNTQIIANKTSWADLGKRRKIENLALMLRGAMEAKERVGLMLNVRKEDLRRGAGGLACAEAAHDLDPERTRLAGGEHRDRGALGLGSDSAAEGSQGAGHRGVSAEQGGDVMRVLSGRAASGARREDRASAARSLTRSSRGTADRRRRTPQRRPGAAPLCRALGWPGREPELAHRGSEPAEGLEFGCSRVALGAGAGGGQYSPLLRNGRNRKSGSVRGLASRSANWCGHSIPSAAMCRAEGIPWFRLC